MENTTMRQSSQVCLWLVALGLLRVTSAAADASVADQPPPAVVARAYELINLARSKSRLCGAEYFPAAPPLATSDLLQRAAQGHAQDMARKHYFEHQGRDGSAPRDRLARLGYASRLSGENIAYGPESAEEVVAGWLASPGHCANIMDARFQEMGLAYAIDATRHATYWVQALAWPGRPLRAAAPTPGS
jgi:uncharacterized protein YkwD